MAATAAQRDESFLVCAFFLAPRISTTKQNDDDVSYSCRQLFFLVCMCIIFISMASLRRHALHYCNIVPHGHREWKLRRASHGKYYCECVAYNLATAEREREGAIIWNFICIMYHGCVEFHGVRERAPHFARNYIEISRWENDLILSYYIIYSLRRVVWMRENSRRIPIKYGRVQQSIKIKCWIASLLQ